MKEQSNVDFTLNLLILLVILAICVGISWVVIEIFTYIKQVCFK